MKSTFSRWACLAHLIPFLLPLSLQAQFGPAHLIKENAGRKFSFQAANINADGHPDLVIQTDYSIVWMENANSDQGFYLHRVITEAGNLGAFQLVDWDTDGDTDLVGVLWQDSIFYWCENVDGNGQFSERQPLALQSLASCIDIADLDGDGFPDILTAAWQTDKVVWFRNMNGSGLFDGPREIDGYAQDTEWVKAIDIDLDGDPDVVYDAKYSGETTWRENQGGGFFGPHQMLYSFGCRDMVQIDLDQDGQKDLVALLNTAGLVWNRNTTSGYADMEIIHLGAASFSIGDQDLDGDLDLLAVSNDTIYQYRQDTPGNFSSNIVDVLFKARDVAFADINGDGFLDVAAINFDPGRVGWYAYVPSNNSFSTFRQPINENARLHWMSAPDLNQDGYPDLLVSYFKYSGDQLAWYPNEQAHFRVERPITNRYVAVSYNTCADMDGDGDTDLVVQDTLGKQIFWLQNSDGLGRFDSVILVTSQVFNQKDVAIADVDHDGDPDIIACSEYQIAWFPNVDGKGHFGPKKLITDKVEYADRLAVTDINGDKTPDIIYAERGYNRMGVIYSSDSTGNFFPLLFHQYPIDIPEQIATGDIDGDGTPDFAIAGSNHLAVHRSLNAHKQELISINGSYRVFFSDLDVDGDLDILTTIFPKSEIVWLENIDGLGHFNQPSLVYAAYADKVLAADIDLDGDPDPVACASTRLEWYVNQTVGAPYIAGRCFWDKNGNGVQDPGELPLANLPVRIEPGSLTGYTRPNGAFRYYVTPGTYTIYFDPENCQKLTTPASYTLSIQNSPVNNLNFGVQYDADSIQVRAFPMPAGAPCSQTAEFRIVITNTGCQEESGFVILKTSPLIQYQSADTNPFSVKPDSITWFYNQLAPGETRLIRWMGTVAGANFTGDTVWLHAYAKRSNGSITFPKTGYFTTIRCAYDPNDKSVIPARGGDNPIYEGEKLLYTIRFQNTGNDTASRVVLRDRLDNHLNWSTFRPLATSHSCETTIDNAGWIEVIFDPIELPDSNTNAMASQGFFCFEVTPKGGIPVNTVLENSAEIYFDANPPVLTNTVLNTVSAPIVKTNQAGDGRLVRVFPNPFNDLLYMQLPEGTQWHLQLFDATGRSCLSHTGDTPFVQLDTYRLPAGYYTFKILLEHNRTLPAYGKVVKP